METKLTAQDHLEAAQKIADSIYKLETGEQHAEAIAKYEDHMNKAIHCLADLITNHGHKFSGSKIIDGNYFLTVSSQDSSGAWNEEDIKATIKSVKLWLGY